jgi:hypothetical protein
MAAMQALEPDEWTDDDSVVAHRARAKAELYQIAQQAKEALAGRGIDTPLFFLIPNSGSSILTFGTVIDPPDTEWEQVREIVSEIVGQTVGLDRVRCRAVICATTHDHQPSGSSISRTPMPTPALQDSGAAR